MADVNRWLHSRDSTTQKSNANLVATSQAGAAEIHDIEHAKARPQPRSRLASYLNTYRNTEKTEPASFEWSSLLPVKDGIYVPKPDQMSNTILQQIVANPMHNLPAIYNNLVLHIIEDHRHLTAEYHKQSQRLQAEIESRSKDNEQDRRFSQQYNHERSMPDTSPPRHSTMSRRNHPSTSTRILDYSPLFSFGDTAEDGSKRGQLVYLNKITKLRRTDHPVRRHTSPSRSMTLTSRAILKADSAKEVLLPLSRQGTNTGGHGATGADVRSDGVECCPNYLTKDQLPSQYIAFVSCLAAQLAKRLDCSPTDLFNDIAEACVDTLERTASAAPVSVRVDIRSTTTSNASRDECNLNVRKIERKDLSHPTAAGSGMAKDTGRQRSFSFQPGDDAKTPSLSKATIDPGKAELVRRRVPLSKDDALLQGYKVERSSDQASGAASPNILFNQDTGISATKSSLRSRNYRENSSRSVVTAIKDSSYRSSSSPQEGSQRLYQATSRSSLGRSEQNPFAIAAARAAGFRDISDTKAGHGGEVAEP